MKRFARLAAQTIGLACILAPLAALSQVFPSKPIRIVVPTSPGPGLDYVVRVTAPLMAESLGQPIVVDNQAGGNGVIGVGTVARATPDGYTILFASPSHVITPVFLMRDFPYDPLKDFTAINAGVEPVTTFTVHPSVPAENVREFIEWARRNPGKVSYGSSGVGSVFHMLGEQFNQVTGLSLTHIPYKGVVPAMADLVRGEVQLTFIALQVSLPQARAGKARILAVLENSRYAAMPELPTIGETVPGFEKPAAWFAYFGPAGLQQPVARRLSAEMTKGLNAADVRPKLEQLGLTIIANTPEQFAQMVKRDYQIWAKAIKSAGLKPE
jgi:tripartite-type tricarboxylate transporter receptor subunit TctC